MTNETQATEAKFVIDGREYEIPSLDTFTMGEALTLYEYSGLALEDIDEAIGGHPGVIAAFMHISYERGNPGVKKAAVRRMIESSNLAEALEQFQGEGDESPPEEAQKSEPQPTSSDERESSNHASSGIGLVTSSVEPDDVPSPTGTSESDTSEPSVPAISRM